MKITLNEDAAFEETQIIINCKSVDEQILAVVASLKVFDRKITGFKDGRTYILEASEILYIDTVDKRTFFYTEKDVYETPLKLYELEERLKGCDFFRAGKSSVVNFNQIKSLRPEFGGKLQLTMNNGECIYVSRQYAGTVFCFRSPL